MKHIKITRGLDIPIKGKPEENTNSSSNRREPQMLPKPAQICLNLRSFGDLKFRLLVKPGDLVKIGQPLIEDKSSTGRMLASPAGGTVKEIRRGMKRVLLDIIIEVTGEEKYQEFPSLDVEHATRQEMIDRLKAGGIFSRIRSRPFGFLADPNKVPRNIFVKAIESAPFAPPAELHMQGHEKEFQIGLNALAKLTDGSVHLVYSKNSSCRAFTEAQNVQKHTAEGPHPISNHSLHIQAIDPIQGSEDNVWTLSCREAIAIGHLFLSGRYHVERIISIAGQGVLPDRIGYFKVREGYPIAGLIAGRVGKGVNRFITGDPLMGHKVLAEDFLGYDDHVFCVIPENTEREFLHFFRLGADKYSFSKAYLSGHLDNKDRVYDFTTSQHGEHRPFIDAALYEKVQPLAVPTMQLVKAVMAEDYELAETMGLLEVESEDFALTTFVCPSKMEMTEIIKNGLKHYAKEVLE